MAQPIISVTDRILSAATELALENGHDEVSTGHLLLAIATVLPNLGADALTAEGVSAEGIRNRLLARKAASGLAPSSVAYTTDAALARRAAGGEASRAGATQVAPEHLLLALMGQINTAVRIVRDLGAAPDRIRIRVQDLVKANAGPPDRNVFVIHGRDGEARQAMDDFLRALDLHPLEWPHLVALNGSNAPYIGDAIMTGFDQAKAAIVLLTPDDFGQCHRAFAEEADIPAEKVLTGQARQNVIFEAGMAMMRMPDQTIFVQIGTLRPFSDIIGRSVIPMSSDREDTIRRLQNIAIRLKNAGCTVNDIGTDWMRPDAFVKLDAHRRGPRS